MVAGRRRRAAGFTLPLTMALAFSLMTLATAIVGMVVVSDKQAKQSALELVTRTTLESAIEQSLFYLERDGEPQTNEWTDRQTLNGRDVELSYWPAHYKPDLNQSPTDDIGAALTDPLLRQRVVAAFAPSTDTGRRPEFKRFIDLVRVVDASPAEEDCLRRRLTIGRQSGVTDPAPPDTAIKPPRVALGAGELIDVRAETRDDTGRRTALWRRVRFSGKPERPWLTHDWRELSLLRTDIDCPLAAPPAKITPDLNLGGDAGPP